MATEQEKALYGCIAVVEDAAKGLKTLQEAVKETIETEARQNIRYEAQSASREIIATSRDLVRELKETAQNARACSKELRRTGLFQGLLMLGMGIVIFGLGFLIFDRIFIPGKVTEAQQLNRQIAEAERILTELESKTWKLELVNYSNGTRGIVLPKGVKIERTTTVKDGREIVLIAK